ncbi:MAG: glycerol kinase GlpK [Labilithrix sp.]|nr:glycerol kinase GlpK [Labilithrix sp.]MBX3217090.1 glycerol kinase GlpK [Labilithrix sp.]
MSATQRKLLAIDQGTTGSTAIVLTLDGETLGKKTVEFPQHFPKPGWVEHDAEQIWKSVEEAVSGALSAARIAGTDIGAIGITNQRETTLVWDRQTGKPVHRAIVWQCRRTAEECDRLKAEGAEPLVRKKTGLVIDAYFSGTKIAWILDAVSGARARADRGELAFGTIDAFLVHRLTGGAVHATDVTNASRTLLMDIDALVWDDEMLRLFRVPASVLPKIVPSAGPIGETRGVSFLPDGIPITGIAGDQQAALFGQACFGEGDAKCTYGTGAFALMNIGKRPLASGHGLITTVAWQLAGKDSAPTYALEGSAFIAGAAVQWLRDGLGLITTAADIESLARKVESSEGVAFVPALAGLGAPYWDQNARGTITGITRGTTAAHLARATLEGIAFEVWDLLEAMTKDAGRELVALKVDGGAAKNDLLAQFQADVAQVTVVRPTEVESTGRGAAMLAGVGAELSDLAAATRMVKLDRAFSPALDAAGRAEHIQRWRRAIEQTRAR